jgi:multisubunit Na+/H+ antiporter MnhC subunit
MTFKPSIHVSKHHKDAKSKAIDETEEQRATRKANAAIEAEIKGASHEKKYHAHHGIVQSMILKHKTAMHKRDQERAALRRDVGSQSHEGNGTSLTNLSDSSDSLLHSAEVVDTLEVVDTEIQTVSTLSNIARSIMVPTTLAGKPPVVHLSTISSSTTETTTTEDETNETNEQKVHGKLAKEAAHQKKHGERLDKHIKEQLQRSRLHQKMISVLKGTWTFIKTPLGILAAIYGFLVVFGGAALVICLAGWIPGNKDLQVEIFSQIENGLFTIPGVGLIPWRIRDTYIIARICHYRNKSNDLRKKRGLSPLQNANDLAFEAGFIPAPLLATDSAKTNDDIPEVEKVAGAGSSTDSPNIPSSEAITMKPVSEEHEHMLSPKEAAALRDLQRRFAKNCTWYRPNETPTHYAYPIGRAVTVTAFVIMNSVFQCLLCAYMWGYASHYHDVSLNFDVSYS